MKEVQQMPEFIEVRWTSGSLDEARKISRLLVQEKLVIHAQIVPWIESIYLLDQKLETTQESKIIMLVKGIEYEKVKERIEKHCSYEIPEVTYVAIGGGNREYLTMGKNLDL